MAEVDTVFIEDEAGATREVATTSKLIKSVGLPTDPKNPANDATPATMIAVLKQISEYLSNTLTAQSAMVASLQDIEVAAESPGDVGVSPGASAVISGTISPVATLGPTIVIPQQAIGIAVALTHLSLTNTTATTYYIRDGSVTKMVFVLPANGQININFTKALLGSAAAAWSVSTLASATFHCNMIGYTVSLT